MVNKQEMKNLEKELLEILCNAIKYGDCCERHDGTPCLRKTKSCQSTENYLEKIMSLFQKYET